MASYFCTNFVFALLHALFVIQTLKFSHSNALTNVSCIGAEREALLKFKQNLTDPLRYLSSWIGERCCEWEGVTCNNRTGHVLELYLGNCDLRGPILATVNQLSSLRSLSLFNNQLSGNIPESIGQLSNLKVMDFRSNQLDGVVNKLHLANLTSLAYLILSLNKLVINVSTSWVPPFQLKFIYLSSCKVGPEFPNWLRTQRNILSLHMSDAGISTEVPYWLPDVLYNTGELDLSSNMLRGNISKIVGKKTPELYQLSLSGNNLSGDISNLTCMLVRLEYLDLSKNQLSGRLSPCWGLLSSLNWISLGDNKLNGWFPKYLCDLKYLRVLGLSKNGLNGVLPKCLMDLSFLEILDLSDNLFTGRIPPFSFTEFKVINLERNYFTGDIPSQLCHNSQLQYLSLAHNNLSGGIPPCFSNFSRMWADSSSSPYPMDEWRRLFFNLVVNTKGMGIEFTWSLQFMFSIDLSSNALEGQIPEGLTGLVQLHNLNLSRNNLIGRIPSNIGNLGNLESLDLSNNKLSCKIPDSISIIYSLGCLDLSFNNLFGLVPSGPQLSTFNSQSVYRGNDALCGAPLLKVCPSDEHNECDSFALCGAPLLKVCPRDEHNEGDSFVNWFYLGLGSGFAVALMGFYGILYVNQSWRIYYFQIVDRIIKNYRLGG